jgi:hypothetical protein
MRPKYRLLAAGASTTVLACAGLASAAERVAVQVQHKLSIRQNVHVSFRAPNLPQGGYYYGVVVLKSHYKEYTALAPPPCSTSSNMRRTNYGFPRSDGRVALALTPAKSAARHWCRGGVYLGAIYAVPHPPPCESTYPCRAEPYKEQCAGVAPGCVLGVVARPGEWLYGDGLPRPLARDTVIVGHFTLRFPR